MQQILLLAGGALLALKDSFKNLKLSKQARLVIIAVVVYFALNYIIKEWQKQNNKDNAPNDRETTFAIRLYTAFHPFIDIEWLSDGTNEDEVISVAKEMKLYKNYNAVSKKYRSLYNRDLTSDLSSEGVYNQFIQNYN